MAHEIATAADGRAGIAYAGQAPWHGLGQRLTAGAPLEDWQREAGLEWTAERSAVQYVSDPAGTPVTKTSKQYDVLYRSDTGGVLSIVSPRYQIVQPKEIIEFYRDLVESHGYELETAGMLKDGKKVWALANTRNVFELRGEDVVKGYLLLATSYDGTLSTQARFTSVRVVCNNTLSVATEGRSDVAIPHSTKFDASKVKLELGIGDAWKDYTSKMSAMSERIVSQNEAVQFFMAAYHNLATPQAIEDSQADPKHAARLEKFMSERMTNALFASPGANLASAKGMLWGLVNAVTYDIDHVAPAHNQGNRLHSAWFGNGEAIKRRAWDLAVEML